MARFELNKRAIEDLGRDAVRQVGKDLERENNRYLNGLSQQMKGQPVDVIHAELQQHYRGQIDLKPGVLSEWAQLVHDGAHFDVRFHVK